MRARMLVGVILGVLLTIALAYVHDTQFVTADASGIARPFVNWDVVNRDWQRLTGRLREEWNRIAANR
jgi:hypothetical protein